MVESAYRASSSRWRALQYLEATARRRGSLGPQEAPDPWQVPPPAWEAGLSPLLDILQDPTQSTFPCTCRWECG